MRGGFKFFQSDAPSGYFNSYPKGNYLTSENESGALIFSVRFDYKSAKKFATMMRNLFSHYKETVLQKKKWEK